MSADRIPDFFDPETFERGMPHDALAWLRENEPVYCQEAAPGPPAADMEDWPAPRGIWLVTRYDDLQAVSRDEAGFSSGRGTTLVRDLCGPHYCLGANLARMEIRCMFEELPDRLPDIAVSGPLRRLRSMVVSSIESLPVRFTPEC